MANITFDSLIELAARLRGPGGCPWDMEQTYETIGPMTIEEAYETLEAIEREDVEGLAHELGDLLFHVVFYSQMGKERGEFTIEDVMSHIHEKLVRRHPHVFGEVSASTSTEVLKNWEAIKKAEKAKESPHEPPALLEGVSTKIPALLEAYQLTARAARVGFDWTNAESVLGKVEEETQELRRVLAQEHSEEAEIKEEIGDLLFALVNLARKLGIDAETALRAANRKFKRRFRHIELNLHQQGRALEASTLEEMDVLWVEAKQTEANAARRKP